MASSTLKQTDFRSDINGLRGISVALVVLFHAHVRLSAGGFVGVDVFFVISGFLMTKIIVERLQADRFSYWGFLKARATRIWPALGGLVGLLTLAGMLLLPPSDLLQLARQGIWAVVFLSNGYFQQHAGYATFAPEGNWFLHTWSLSVEWQFYLLYPALVWLPVRLARRPSGAPPALGPARWLLLVLFAASLAAYLWRCHTNPDAAFFGLAYRAWQMLAGGLVYLWIAHGQDGPATPGVVMRARGQAQGALVARLRTLGSYAGVGVMLLGALWIGHQHLDPVGIGALSLLPVAGTALVLAGADRRNPLLNNPPLQALGRWSYSIYLWHWPLIVICAMDAVLEQHPVGGTLAVIGLSVLLGAASYRFIETASTRRATRGLLLRYRPLALLAGAALVTVLSLATDGLKFGARAVDDASINKPALESDYFPDRCSNFRKPIEEVHPCVIERGARRVLIIGDSLAEHYYPWFKAHSVASVDFMTESECPPVPNFDRLQNGFHCMDYADLAWREAASDRYDTVILSANWMMVGVLGPAYCHREGSECRVLQNGPERTQLVLSELKQALERLLAAGKTVVFMDPTPGAHVHVPPRLAREQLWFGAPRYTISAAAVDEDNAWIEGMLGSLATQPGFHLVSMRPAFCDAQRCATYDATLKRPIFVDDRHFDPLWVRDHAQVFAPFSGAEAPPR